MKDNRKRENENKSCKVNHISHLMLRTRSFQIVHLSSTLNTLSLLKCNFDFILIICYFYSHYRLMVHDSTENYFSNPSSLTHKELNDDDHERMRKVLSWLSSEEKTHHTKPPAHSAMPPHSSSYLATFYLKSESQFSVIRHGVSE